MSTTTEIRDSVYAGLLAKSLPRPIRTDAELARFTETLLALDGREDLSPEEGALAEVLTLLIEDYEERHHPLPRVSPNESLNALMESGRRSISKAQAKRVSEFLHVPLDLFV